MNSRFIVVVAGVLLSLLGGACDWAFAAQAVGPPGAKQRAVAAESKDEALPEPFKLTKAEQATVDRVLARWENWNAGVKTFDCRFKRWTYDLVFGKADRPMFVEQGSIRYAAPGRVAFWVDQQESGGKMVDADQRAERWLFDGRSVFTYNKSQRAILEHLVPPDTQRPFSRAIDGPLAFGTFGALVVRLLWAPASATMDPFPFGAKTEDLKRQYYLRAVTPAGCKDQVWLEAYPRTKPTAASLQRLELVLVKKDMSPFAMQIVNPNGRSHTNYQFYEISVNGVSKQAADDWFRPPVPAGWRLIRDTPAPRAISAASAGRLSAASSREAASAK